MGQLMYKIISGGVDLELCGEKVRHGSFGRGEIVEFSKEYVTVLFDDSKEEKKFGYPAVFGEFLELENKSFLKEIQEDKDVIAEKEADDKRVKQALTQLEIALKSKEEIARRVKKTTEKTSDSNNIAFKCNYCDGGKSEEIVGYKGVCSDETIKYNIKTAKHVWCRQPENMCYKYLQGEISREEIGKFYDETKSEFGKSVCCESQMLELWKAGAGITQNADGKSKPMSLKNARANSLAVLTTKLPRAKDQDRFIFAVFLIDEDYEGDIKGEGHLGSNPKYRIQLSLEEAKELKFWNYYFNPKNPEKIILGSGLHRYLTDTQSAQILKKICEIKKDTSEEESSKEFLERFCRLKKLDINNIPETDGGLQRIMKSKQ